MSSKRNDEEKVKYEKDMIMAIILTNIGALAILASGVFTLVYMIGIKIAIGKYLLYAFIFIGVSYIVFKTCYQLKHRNDFRNEYEKNLNEIMGK